VEAAEAAEAADHTDEDDGLILPDQIARRQALKDKLDAAARRLEEAAARNHDDKDTPATAPSSGHTNQFDGSGQCDHAKVCKDGDWQ
jgi:hypothetical protein